MKDVGLAGARMGRWVVNSGEEILGRRGAYTSGMGWPQVECRATRRCRKPFIGLSGAEFLRLASPEVPFLR